MKNRDGCEMGGTGGEDFVASPSGRPFHGSDNNENIGSENDHQTAYFIEGSKNEKDFLTKVGIRAGHSNNSRMLTKLFMNFVPQKNTFNKKYMNIKEQIILQV